MIIVSQDRKMIFNLKNIIAIELTGDLTVIRCQTDKINYWLGVYKTEERAMEVLQEIAQTYKLFETYKATIGADIKNMLMKEMDKINCSMFSYYMPKE